MKRSLRFLIYLLATITIFAIFYAVFVRFGRGEASPTQVSISQDSLLLVLAGTSGLYSILTKYRLSAIGFSLILVSITLIFYPLLDNLFLKVFDSRLFTRYFHIDLSLFLRAFHAAYATLLANATVLGRLGIYQMAVSSLIFLFAYSLNIHICQDLLRMKDAGGTISIQLFASIYSILLAVFVQFKNQRRHPDHCHSYESGTAGLMGAALTWVFWPSFNALLVTKTRQVLAVINTLMAISISMLLLIAINYSVSKKLAVERVVRFSPIAGLAIGASCDLITNPSAAMMIGIISTYVVCNFYDPFYDFFKENLFQSLTMLGVNLLASLVGAFLSLVIIAFYSLYGYQYPPQEFPRFDPVNLAVGLQAASIFVTIFLAAVFGALAGVIIKYLMLEELKSWVQTQCFLDEGVRMQEGVLFHDYAQWDLQRQTKFFREDSVQSLNKIF